MDTIPLQLHLMEILVLNFDVPLEMKYDSQNELRANIGFRFNITVFAIQANYTFSEYPTATLGVGVSLR